MIFFNYYLLLQGHSETPCSQFWNDLMLLEYIYNYKQFKNGHVWRFYSIFFSWSRLYWVGSVWVAFLFAISRWISSKARSEKQKKTEVVSKLIKSSVFLSSSEFVGKELVNHKRTFSLDLWSLIVVINISSYVYKTHICKSSPLTFPYITNGLSRTTRNDDVSYMKYAGYKYYNTSGNDGENWLHLAFLPYNVFQFQVHYILFWKLLFLLLIVPHWTDMNF